MKKLLVIILLLFSIYGNSQNDTIINRLGKTIQIIVKKDTVWEEKLYSSESRKLFSHGAYIDDKLKVRVGRFIFYDKEGKVKRIASYNNKGKYHGKYVSLNKSVKRSIGNYLNGKRNGLWNFYDQDGGKLARIVYKEDKVIKYDLWDEAGNKMNEPLIIEQRPEFKGGNKALYRKIKKELAPKLNRLKGKFKSFVVFTVNEHGLVENVIVKNPLTPIHKKIIEDFFYGLPKWKPAVQLNRNIKMSFTIPLKLN